MVFFLICTFVVTPNTSTAIKLSLTIWTAKTEENEIVNISTKILPRCYLFCKLFTTAPQNYIEPGMYCLVLVLRNHIFEK